MMIAVLYFYQTLLKISVYTVCHSSCNFRQAVKWTCSAFSAALSKRSRPAVYSTDRSKAMVPAVFLLVNSTRRFILSLALRFALCFQSFQHCNHLTWGRENWSLCFSCVCLFCAWWFCPFPLPFGVRDWLRLVIVALSGLFVLPFCFSINIARKYCVGKGTNVNKEVQSITRQKRKAKKIAFFLVNGYQAYSQRL